MGVMKAGLRTTWDRHHSGAKRAAVPVSMLTADSRPNAQRIMRLGGEEDFGVAIVVDGDGCDV